MGRFSTLTAADLAAAAEAFDVGVVEQAQALEAGTVNTNLALRTSRGRFFLRVNEGKAEAEVAAEAALVEALAQRGVPTPRPCRAQDGRPYAPWRDRFLSLFPWIEGVQRSDDVSVVDAHALGAALAAVHEAGLMLPPSMWPASRYDDRALEGRRAQIAAADRPELTAPVAALQAEAAWLASQHHVRAAAAHGLTHGDLFRDNVLWATGARARIAALLDFEQAAAGSLAYDVAVCVNDWAWDEVAVAVRADLARALLGGYQTVRPLDAATRQALPVELRAAAARFATTRLTDVYLAGIAKPDKDFRAYLARLQAWQGGQLGALVASV